MMIEKLPPRIHHAYWFQAFNAVSWQICLGTPLILFARELGAPAFVLGVLAGLAPLTSVLQLLVAPYAERIGYRKLMLRGWTARVVTLVLLAVLPLAGGIAPPAVLIVATVAIMLAFTALRGIAMCAWLPWITLIVPRSLRGFYLSRDRIFISLASVASLAVSGVFLMGHRDMSAYAIVFGLGFAGGAVSLYFLNRIPEPPDSAGVVASSAAMSQSQSHWRPLLRNEGFKKLVIFSAIVQVVVLSTGAFVTVFAREETRLSDGVILWAAAAASLAGTVALALLRNRIDALGSRPFLGVVFLWWAVYYALWFLLAISPAPSSAVAVGMMALAGFFGSIYDLALTRLLMNTVGDQPEATRYFALHSVIVSVLNGFAPMVWGLALDVARVALAGISLSGYALLFAAQWALLGLVLVILLQVREASSISTRRLLRDTLLDTPRAAAWRLAARRAASSASKRRSQ